MGDVLQFTPRPKPVTADILEPLAGAALRASLEEAAQTALDAADRIIAVLDRMDGDADHEDGGDAEPSLAVPENATGSQVVYMRGSDRDGEADAPEIVLPEVVTEPEALVPPLVGMLAAEPKPEAIVLPWRGRGNVIAAVGVALLDMVGGR